MKKKRALAILLAVSLLPSALAGCGKKEEPAAVEEETQEEAEEDSVYQEFDFVQFPGGIQHLRKDL